MLLALSLLVACNTSRITTNNPPSVPAPDVPAELLDPLPPVPRISATVPVTMGALVLYTGDLLDHDKACVARYNALVNAIKADE